jgi:hypothetical protein
MVPPTTLIVKISRCRAAILEWDANTESDLAGYKVYFGTSSRDYTSVYQPGNVTSIDLTDLGLYEGGEYYIALTAYDYSFNESAFSSELTFFADDEIPPDEDNCPNTYNPDQEDTMPPEGNGIGNACECLADINCNGKVDLADLNVLKQEFSVPLSPLLPCSADLNYDGKVNLVDTLILRTEFLRIDCPACP